MLAESPNCAYFMHFLSCFVVLKIVLTINCSPCDQGWGQLQIGNYNYGINYRPNIIINYNYNYTVTAQVQLQLQLHQGGFQLCN